MWRISAYEYVVDEAKITKIFPVCFQASGFPSQSSEYAFECYHKQLGRHGIFLSYSSPDVDLVAFVLWVNCHRGVGVDILQEFDVHNISPVLEARSVLLEFALNRRLSRSRRIRCREEYFILCTSPSVGLRRGCGLSLSIRFLIQIITL